MGAERLWSETCSGRKPVSMYIGRFENEEEAARAYDDRAREEGFPETALNFPIKGTPRRQERVKPGQNFQILHLCPDKASRELGMELLQIVEDLDFHGAAVAALEGEGVPEERLEVCS
jgi:hypothetical protein